MPITEIKPRFHLRASQIRRYLNAAETGDGLYMSPHFTVLPSLLCLPILAAISVFVPYCTGKTLHRDSIVERLREAE